MLDYLSSKQKQDLKASFARNWLSGGIETPCGLGSKLESTKEIRKALPQIFNKYQIKKVNDAGCGDFNWIKEVDLSKVDYIGYDINNRKKKADLPFQELDICTKLMRKCDLIICRDVLFHLPNEYILITLDNFKKVSNYLLATSFNNFDNKREFMKIRDFKEVNLEIEPFNLGIPIDIIKEERFNRFIGFWVL